MSTHWRNWSGGVEGRPRQSISPATTEEVAAIVKAADGEKVKARGSGHSFTPIAVTDGIQLEMSRLNQVIKVDKDLVTVQGGITIAKLNDELAARGLALENMGDIDQQTITGAISTGTHGTGAKFGSIATQVRALELVTADGSIVTCSPTERPALFSAATGWTRRARHHHQRHPAMRSGLRSSLRRATTPAGPHPRRHG